MFIERISKMKHKDQFVSTCETLFMPKDKCESLGSISAFVTKKEECDDIAEEMLLHAGEEESSEEDSDIASETDDEEYQCVVCRLDFVGEDKFEQHRRISQHRG